MSNYESGNTGIGVGKRYGERYIGGATGILNTLGGEIEIDIVMGHHEMNGPLNFKLPANARITSAYIVVEEAFLAASNLSFKVGSGGTAITTPANLTIKGNKEVSINGLAPAVTGDNPDDLVVTPNAKAKESMTGRAKLVITAKRV